MLPAFRAAYPLLVPTHICFYMVHMIQEHFDIYKKVDRDLAEGCVHPEYVTVSRTKKDM